MLEQPLSENTLHHKSVCASKWASHCIIRHGVLSTIPEESVWDCGVVKLRIVDSWKW